jgi:hydantoinase/carbamoylase family amidase
LFRYRIHVTGIPDHPGTTPFSLRDDALKKASRLLEKSYELFSKKEGALMGNFGDIRIGPGGFNVVPAKAVLNLELRSTSYDLLEETEETFLKMAHQIDPGITTEKVLKKRGVPMDGRMIEAIVASLKDLGYGYAFMPSGAGHDVTSFVPTVPTGMIFVPSIDGKSHSPLEYSSPEAVTAGARTLLATLLRLGDKVLSAS